jgi:hypothetical protein
MMMMTIEMVTVQRCDRRASDARQPADQSSADRWSRTWRRPETRRRRPTIWPIRHETSLLACCRALARYRGSRSLCKVVLTTIRTLCVCLWMIVFENYVCVDNSLSFVVIIIPATTLLRLAKAVYQTLKSNKIEIKKSCKTTTITITATTKCKFTC